MNKRAKGTIYEKKAAEYLESAGYHVVQANYRCKAGEIDLIARQGGYLVFVEVKYRRDGRSGDGAEAVDVRKQRRITKAALWYLTERHMDTEVPCRFDVISFQGQEIHLIQDAFQC